MSVESNKEVVRQAYGSITDGNLDGFLDRLADDATYTFFGNHRFARTFDGKADIVDNLLVPISEVLEANLKLEITNLIAEGDQVVMEALGQSDTKAGGTYNNIYCLVFTVRDGKIAAVREYLDTELVTSVFGALQDDG